jgi:ribosome-binding protein aMBF1 (putative translation factor)
MPGPNGVQTEAEGFVARGRAFEVDRAVGLRIRERREALGKGQREVARFCVGVSAAYLSRIEDGERAPTISALVEIANALDVSALYLATGQTDGFCPVCHGVPRTTKQT